MKQRLVLRLALSTVTLAAACAGAVAGNVLLGLILLACSIAVFAAPLSKAWSQAAVAALLDALREAQRSGAPAIKAVVGSSIIFIRVSAVVDTSRGAFGLLLRDEVELTREGRWRELSTLLRHQSHDPQAPTNVDGHPATRFGSSHDL